MDLSTASASQGVKAPKGTASMQTDSFAVLLVQGLESNDANILNVRVQNGVLLFWVFFVLSFFVMIQNENKLMFWAKAVLN